METLWIMICIWFVLFAGSCLQGIVGFGMGLFAVGWMSLFLPVKDVTLIILALTVIMSSWVVRKLWKYIRWKIIASVLVGTAIGRVGSFWFIHNMGDTALAKQWLGITLIIIVILLYANGKFEQSIRAVTRPRLFAAFIGMTGGFIGGAFAIGGPIYAIYFLIAFKDKRKYNVNMQATFVISNLSTLIVHGIAGDMSPDFWFYTMTGIIPVLLGIRIGYSFFSKLSKPMLRHLASSIVLVSAIMMLWVNGG